MKLKTDEFLREGGNRKMERVVTALVEKYLEYVRVEKRLATRSVELYAEEQDVLRPLFLLTMKPTMYVCNVDEGSAVSGNQYVEQVREAVQDVIRARTNQ